MWTPSQPRRTRPFLINCLITGLATDAGIANPMPTLPPVGEKIAVLMPMTSPFQVEHRAARIAAVDGGVGLQKIVVGTGIDIASARRDDAGRHGAAQAEGIADGDHPVADPGDI